MSATFGEVHSKAILIMSVRFGSARTVECWPAPAKTKHRDCGVWSVSDGKQLAALKGHTQRVSDAVFSPDGSLLATVSDDRTAQLWKVPSGERVMELEWKSDYGKSAAFSPNGKVLATGGYETIQLWAVAEGKMLREIMGHKATRAKFSRWSSAPTAACSAVRVGTETTRLSFGAYPMASRLRC